MSRDKTHKKKQKVDGDNTVLELGALGTGNDFVITLVNEGGGLLTPLKNYQYKFSKCIN